MELQNMWNVSTDKPTIVIYALTIQYYYGLLLLIRS